MQGGGFDQPPGSLRGHICQIWTTTRNMNILVVIEDASVTVTKPWLEGAG